MVLNPATFLLDPQEGTLEHDCQQALALNCFAHEDLKDTPLPNPDLTVGGLLPITSLLKTTDLERSLNLTQSLLYKANSSPASNCWMCLSMSSSAYIALAVPLSKAHLPEVSLAYRGKREPRFLKEQTL